MNSRPDHGKAGVWRRLRSLWPGALRQQVTRTGLIYAVSTVTVFTIAFLSANNLVFLVAAAMMAVLGVSGFVSKLGLAGLEIDLALPAHISARRKIQGQVRLRNLKRRISSFSIKLSGAPGSGVESSVYFPMVGGARTVEETIGFYFPSRGLYRERTFELHTRFPFGFAERRESVTLRHEVIVYPCLDPQPGFEELLASVSGELESLQRGRGHDFYRIRPYETTESARHVDWKATAHTGSLQVREFVSDEDHRAAIYLDVYCPPERREWFEKAVDCAAFLAYRLNIRGTRVRLRTTDFDVSLPQEGDIHTILNYLAVVSPKVTAPQRGAWLDGLHDSGCVHVVFTFDPTCFPAAGLDAGGPVRVMGPNAFPREPDAATDDRGSRSGRNG